MPERRKPPSGHPPHFLHARGLHHQRGCGDKNTRLDKHLQCPPKRRNPPCRPSAAHSPRPCLAPRSYRDRKALFDNHLKYSASECKWSTGSGAAFPAYPINRNPPRFTSLNCCVPIGPCRRTGRLFNSNCPIIHSAVSVGRANVPGKISECVTSMAFFPAPASRANCKKISRWPGSSFDSRGPGFPPP